MTPFYIPRLFTMSRLCIALCLLQSLSSIADESSVAASASSTPINMQDRLRSLDQNHDGMVSVYEVRSFIENVHGKAYQQDALNDMESSANGKSCSTPFAKPLY